MVNKRLALATHILGILAVREWKNESPATSEYLAECMGANPVEIRRVLSQLNSAGLVESRRGSGGGSVLAMRPGSINLRMAYEAVHPESPSILSSHAGRGTDTVGIMIEKYLNTLCGDAEEAMLSKLATVSVEHLSQWVMSRLSDKAN